MKVKLIAPCGMNCRLCMAYQRDKNKCNGCNSDKKAAHCQSCIVRNCTANKTSSLGLCSDKCIKFPCKRLKAVDKRYSTKYRMSMIENLLFIQENGIDAFLENEEKRWTCSKCGNIVCVHYKVCKKCSNE
jgi:hypothetical protein